MSKEEILLSSLRTFFSEPANATILIDILVNKTGISLRRLESFITIQSKRDNVMYTTKSGRQFVVHVAYKSSLVGYSKKLFDPFCRTARIEFKVNDQHTITTTVAQLNFIKWCIMNDIIDFIKIYKPENMFHSQSEYTYTQSETHLQSNSV